MIVGHSAAHEITEDIGACAKLLVSRANACVEDIDVDAVTNPVIGVSVVKPEALVKAADAVKATALRRRLRSDHGERRIFFYIFNLWVATHGKGRRLRQLNGETLQHIAVNINNLAAMRAR